MRALAIAVGASLAVNAVAIVWLRPVAAGIVAANHDSDVSRAERDQPDPEDEVVVELLDEPSASPSPMVGVASPGLARTPVAAIRAPDVSVRAATVAMARPADATGDSSVRASDSSVGASDSSVRASDGSAQAGTITRTLDAVLAPPDASTGGQVSDGAHSKLMTMRGANLALTTDAVDAILSRPRPPDANATRRGAAHETPEAPDPPDEAAQLRHDIAELDKRLMGPDLGNYATDDEIDGLREDLESKKKDLAQMTIHPTGGGRYGAEHETYTASIEPDGTTHLEDRPNLQRHGIQASFDVTDWAMRWYGDDPYARAKMRFLDRTRPERIAIGMHYRTEQLAHTPQLMQANIERVWATIPDSDARKQALFELWDDCAETGEPAVVEAGATARAFVLGVIRARVTYTAEELARLNARRHSAARFEP